MSGLINDLMGKVLLFLSFSSLRGQEDLMSLSSSLSPALCDPRGAAKEAPQNEGEDVIPSAAHLPDGEPACFLPLTRGPGF